MTWLGMHASVMEQVLHTAATAEAEYPWVSQRDRVRASGEFRFQPRTKADSEKKKKNVSVSR